MTFAFTLLRDGSDYTFIWSPPAAQAGGSRPAAAHSYWAKISLQAHQQAELEAAIDSAAQVPLQLRTAGEPNGDGARSPIAEQTGAADLPLRRLGRVLFSHILPDPLQATIRQLPPATPLLIQTNETELPWELLHDGQAFLALRHAVARQMLLGDLDQQPDGPPRQDRRCLLIGNPNDNLPAADVEIEKLLDLLDTSPIPLRVEFLCRDQATKLRVLSALASGEYQILHFACHARPGALSLADGWLQADEIRTILRGNPLVFLNGCSSGRTAQAPPALQGLAGVQTHSLAHAFLAGGATAFLGTLWPIDDNAMHLLALEFYRALCYGQTLGTALRLARSRSMQRAAEIGAWAAPVLYGDPTYQLPSPALRTQPGTLLTVRLADAPHATPEESGREETLAAQRQFLQRAAACVTEHGGSLLSLHAGRLSAVFGVPEAQEDDAARATQAALELARLAEAHRQSLAAAVASGEITVSAGADINTLPGASLYLGELFAESEQLAAQARAGQVLVNARARRLGDGKFAFVSLRPGVLPSDDDEAKDDVYEVAPRATPDPSPLEAQPLVVRAPGQLLGRARELRLLHEHWVGAAGGRGCVVGIAGEAGVGKTRLLEAFRSSLSRAGDALPRDYAWVGLACAAAGQERPYALIGQLLRHIFEVGPDEQEAEVDAKIAQQLAAVPGVQTPLDPQLHQILRETLGLASPKLPVDERKARRGRLVHLLRTLMAHEVQSHPLLVAIDDAHWIDEASLEILSQVTDGISRLPVQFVLLYRPAWQHAWFDKPYYRHLPLEELDEVACIELICVLLQTQHLPKGLSPLLQKTGGNPFFIAEMVKSLQERGVLVRRSGGRDAGQAGGGEWVLQQPLTGHQLPGTVERVLRVRLERLPPATRQVLEVAAVIGPTFTLSLLRTLLGTLDEPLEPHLAELEGRGFVEARWQVQDYRFCHALILDTIYQDMPPSQRQAWHRRIAETLEAGRDSQHIRPEVESLAHHYYQSLLRSRPTETARLDEGAPPQQIAKALTYLQQCGTHAQERYAAREAINYYQRALRVLPLAPARQALDVALHEGLGDAYNMLGQFDLACEALRQAYAALHAQPLTQEDCRRAADLARRVGRLCAWQGEHEEGLRWMHQGLRELGERADDADHATAALLHIHMGAVHYNKGDHEEALRWGEAGLHLAEASHATAVCAEGHNLLGVICSSTRQNSRALDHYDKSLHLWQARGNTYQVMRVAGNIGIVHYDEGNLSEAQRYYAQGLDYLEQIEDLDRLAYRHLNLGNVYLCRGEWTAAQTSFETALALWEQMGNQRWIALCHTNLGLLAIEQAEWAQAEAWLTTGRDLLTRLDIRDMLPEVLYSLAEVALGRSLTAEALALAQQAASLAAELEMPFETALARRCAGRALIAAGQVAEGRALLEESVEQLRSLSSRFEVGRTLYWLATVRAAAGETRAAQAAAQEAQDIFTQMGAHHEEAKLKALAVKLTPVFPRA